MTDPIPGITRCAIYTRKSREFTGEYSSRDAQFDACHTFMRAHASLGCVWNGRRYDDQGESGARRDRPALTQLFADVAAGNVERVIVYRLDRLARNLLQGTSILQEVRDQNVAFTIVTAPELGCTAQDSLVLNILASFAEFELELTRERLREARVAYKNHGSESRESYRSATRRTRSRSNLSLFHSKPSRCGAFSSWRPKEGRRRKSPGW